MKNAFGLLLFALAVVGTLGAQQPPDLFLATRTGTVAEVKAAIARGESLTQVQSSDGLTPLLFAARYNTPEVAQALIDAGSNLSKRDAAGASILFNALMFNPDLKMTLLFLKAGNKLLDRDSFGAGPLIHAILNPIPEVFRYVLAQKGVQATERDGDGRSALAWAVNSASPEVVQDLLKAGAVVNDKDARGWTPLMTAAGVSAAKVQVLLKQGARLEDRTQDGATAFLIAAGNRDLDIVRTLVGAGSKTDVRDNNGANALMTAALFNTNPDMIGYLLGLGLKVNDVDKENKTALNWASGNQNPEVAATLKRAGAVATDAALITTPKEPSPLPSGTWVVLEDGSLRLWKNDAWAAMPGRASAVAQGGGQVWALAASAVDGNLPLLRWNGTAVLALNESGTAPDVQVLDGRVLLITATVAVAVP